MAENHEHSRYIYNSYYYDGHRLDPSDLDLKAYINELIADSPGGGTPGGSDKQIQYNNNGAFGGVLNGSSGQVLTSNGAGSAPSFQASPGGSSYLVYTASLAQGGTNAPVPTLMGTPTIVGTLVWSYNADGDFTVTLAGAFPGGRTIVFIAVDNLVFNSSWQHVNEDSIKLFTFDETWTGMNNFNNVSFEIRVYPA